MIITTNGTLTYSSLPSPVVSWRPNNDIAFVLLLALVTTVISYQVTFIFFDIALGHKPRHCAAVSDLLINRLTLSGSLLTALRSIFGSHSAQLHEAVSFVPGKPEYRANRYDSIPFTTLTKLFFLLIAGPVMNIIAIILSTEYETELTFKEAGFGTMAVGLNKGLSTLPLPNADTDFENGYSRIQIPIHAPSYDSPLVRLYHETSIIVGERPIASFYSNLSVFRIELGPRENDDSLSLQFLAPTTEVFGFTYVSMEFTEGEKKNGLYRIRLIENLDALAELHKLGTERIIDLCGTEDYEGKRRVEGPEILQYFNCFVTPQVLQGLHTVFFDVMKKITLVDHPEVLKVTRDGDSKILSVKDEIFLRRRSNYLGLPALLIIAGVLVIARVGTAFSTRNDVSTGIGFVIRFMRGMPCCDTMLIDDEDKDKDIR